MAATLTESRIHDLQALALRVREHIVRMSTDGGCFTGASLSCADLLVYLYSDVLNISPDNLRSPDRDYCFLSKGHDVPALYATLAERGFFAKERLKNHLKTNDFIYWHPNVNMQGVEFHSGSLGHLLSVAMGVALDCKLRGQTNRIVVILGDGELNEGTIWEGTLVAKALKLGNLTVIVDRNEFQANIRTEDLVPLEPIENKFRAFGWETARVNGHDFTALNAAWNALPATTGDTPTVIIADTVRGKGIPSIERRADRWFCNFSHDEVKMLVQELHGEAIGELTSEALHVR